MPPNRWSRAEFLCDLSELDLSILHSWTDHSPSESRWSINTGNR